MHTLYRASYVRARWAYLKREEGQGAVEYALVVLGVAADHRAAVAGFTGHITNFMATAGDEAADLIPVVSCSAA